MLLVEKRVADAHCSGLQADFCRIARSTLSLKVGRLLGEDSLKPEADQSHLLHVSNKSRSVLTICIYIWSDAHRLRFHTDTYMHCHRVYARAVFITKGRRLDCRTTRKERYVQ